MTLRRLDAGNVKEGGMGAIEALHLEERGLVTFDQETREWGITEMGRSMVDRWGR